MRNDVYEKTHICANLNSPTKKHIYLYNKPLKQVYYEQITLIIGNISPAYTIY